MSSLEQRDDIPQSESSINVEDLKETAGGGTILTKAKLDSLKKARSERTRKAEELNKKELNIIHALENIYTQLNSFDIRINSLDSHIRSKDVIGKRSAEEIEEPPKKKTKLIEDDIDMDDADNTDDGGYPSGLWRPMLDTFLLFSAFVAFRFSQSYFRAPRDDDHHTTTTGRYASAFD